MLKKQRCNDGEEVGNVLFDYEVSEAVREEFRAARRKCAGRKSTFIVSFFTRYLEIFASL